MTTKFIFVTGGVVSSLGKGLAAASIGSLLEARGFRVTLQKMDPYINVDAGTMSPYQHGEVYVTDDGGETDLDLGHYERFTSRAHDPGQQHHHREGLRDRDREGAPRRLSRAHRPGHPAHHRRDQGVDPRRWPPGVDVVIVEIGGTVGDIEGLPFLEAIRQFKKDVGRDNVDLHPPHPRAVIAAAGELKTKATQHSVKELRAIGIQPDILLCRDRPLRSPRT